MQRFLSSKLYLLFYLAVTAISCITSGRMAMATGFNTHPDESDHAAAFCYFEKHWWPPELNSNELSYDPYGGSRVYGGEVVYLVYGRISRLIRPMFELASRISAGSQRTLQPGSNRMLLPLIMASTKCGLVVETYRLQNTLLLLVTLLVLFKSGAKHIWATVIAGVLVCIPQVIYVYSYANSDAWGITWSLFLFVFAATHKRPFGSYRDTLWLGILTGIVFLSKQPHWLSVPFSYVLVGWNAIKHSTDSDAAQPRILIARMILLVALVAVIIAPLKIIYPLSQGDFAARMEQMREERAWVEFKPSNPTSPGYRLAARGVSFEVVYTDSTWAVSSAKSFYGLFNYMTLELPDWIYHTAAAVALLCVLLTFGMVLFRWNTIPGSTRLLLLLAPAAFTLAVAASVYYSWIRDLQPQGRYLFPALAPIALLLGGTIDVDPRWIRAIRIAAWLFLYVLCLYVLWAIVMPSPQLKG